MPNTNPSTVVCDNISRLLNLLESSGPVKDHDPQVRRTELIDAIKAGDLIQLRSKAWSTYDTLDANSAQWPQEIREPARLVFQALLSRRDINVEEIQRNLARFLNQ